MGTLAEATRRLAETVGQVVNGQANVGSATTLVDIARLQVDEYFTGGTIWILSGGNAGKSVKITDWDLASRTFTFPPLTLACAAGDRYAAAPRDFPREQLIIAINQAFRDIYRLPAQYTDATFLTVAHQESYTLPAGVNHILRVEVALEKNEPYDWQTYNSWKELFGNLFFDTGCAPTESDYPIRLTYEGQPNELVDDTDELHPLVHLDRLRWEAAINLLRWKLPTAGDKEGLYSTLLNEAMANAALMRGRRPAPQMLRDPHYSGW